MGKTLVISEVISTKEVETEKKFLFIEYNSTTTFKYFYFKVQYPDNSEELFKWDVIEMTYTPEEEEDTLTEKKLKRKLRI